MSDEEQISLEEGSFEVEELDEGQLEDVAGGANTEPTNGSHCTVNGSC